MSQQTPEITCLEDGPYMLKCDDSASVSLCRNDAGVETVEKVTKVFLCRCGASANKPYCDGTHKKIGFSDARQSDGVDNRRDSYVGKKITIHDNRAVCAHAGVCTDNLPGVFRMGQEPWIDADGAAADEIIGIVEKCPSGALSYSIVGERQGEPAGEARIEVVGKGPYAVSGGVGLGDIPFGDGLSGERYTLCRCGASKNKPFCDGSHWDVDFDDAAG